MAGTTAESRLSDAPPGFGWFLAWVLSGALIAWTPAYFVGIFLGVTGAAVALLMPRAGWRWPAPLGFAGGLGVGLIGLVLLELGGDNCSLGDGEGPLDSCFIEPRAGIGAGVLVFAAALAAFYLARSRLGRSRGRA